MYGFEQKFTSFHESVLSGLSGRGTAYCYAFDWTPDSANYVVLYSRRISSYQKYRYTFLHHRNQLAV